MRARWQVRRSGSPKSRHVVGRQTRDQLVGLERHDAGRLVAGPRSASSASSHHSMAASSSPNRRSGGAPRAASAASTASTAARESRRCSPSTCPARQRSDTAAPGPRAAARRAGRDASRAGGRARAPMAGRRAEDFPGDGLGGHERDVALELQQQRVLTARDEMGTLRLRPQPLRVAMRDVAATAHGAGRAAAPSRPGAGPAPRTGRDRPRRPGRCCRVPSSRGEKTPMPSWPGRTAMMPPQTPLFAGRPTVYIHSPARRTCRTWP